MADKMTKDFIYRFIQSHTLAVVSTITKENRPESALVGIAVSENLEIIFDTGERLEKISKYFAEQARFRRNRLER